MTTRDYPLGVSRSELDRLDLQADYYRAPTLDALRQAGIGPGMRVLDLGSGTGAVAFLVAELVGPTGSVLGVDAADTMVQIATDRAAGRGLDQVSFRRADLDSFADEAFDGPPFDAVVGRLITMYLPDASATLARLSRLVRPGGALVLCEFAMTACRQVPERPLFRTTRDRMFAAFAAAGVPVDHGYALDGIIRRAGLDAPTVTIGGRWETGPDATTFALLSGIVGTLLPIMVRAGIATEAEVDLPTLEDRLRAEGADAGSAAPLLISAIACFAD